MATPTPTPTSQTIVNTTVPQYLEPYVIDAAKKAQAIAGTEYQPYPGDRLSDFTQAELDSFYNLGILERPQEFLQAGQGYRDISALADPAAAYALPEARRLRGLAEESFGDAGTRALSQADLAMGDARRLRGLSETSFDDLRSRAASEAGSALSDSDLLRGLAQGSFGAAGTRAASGAALSESDRLRDLAEGSFGDVGARARSGAASALSDSDRLRDLAGQGYRDISRVAAPASQTAMGAAAQYAGTAPEEFTAARAAQYSSPYQQAVTDRAIRRAQEEALRQSNLANLQAGRMGQYGSTRQAVMQGMRDRELREQVADITTTGAERAFLQAQQQFERDQQRRAQQAAQAAQFGIAALGQDFGAVRGLADQGTEAGRLSVAALGQDLGAARGMADVAGQAGQLSLGSLGQEIGAARGMAGVAGQAGQLGLGALGQDLSAVRGLQSVGGQLQSTDLTRILAQQRAGTQQRAHEQQGLDLQYGDFLRQRDYPKEQLGFYSGVLRGLPSQMGSNRLTYAQPPNPMTQLAGAAAAGLGAFGLKN